MAEMALPALNTLRTPIAILPEYIAPKNVALQAKHAWYGRRSFALNFTEHIPGKEDIPRKNTPLFSSVGKDAFLSRNRRQCLVNGKRKTLMELTEGATFSRRLHVMLPGQTRETAVVVMEKKKQRVLDAWVVNMALPHEKPRQIVRLRVSLNEDGVKVHIDKSDAVVMTVHGEQHGELCPWTRSLSIPPPEEDMNEQRRLLSIAEGFDISLAAIILTGIDIVLEKRGQREAVIQN